MIPAFAKSIVEARRSGKRPEGTVFVTEDWDIAKFWQSRGNAAVVVKDGQAYDFRFLHGLDVTIQTRTRLPQVGVSILEIGPRTLLIDCLDEEKPEWAVEPH